MDRARRVLLCLAGLAGGGALLQGLLRSAPAGAATTHTFEFVRTDAEWHEILTPPQYRVLRQAGTEYPFTSPLDREKRRGTFACAGCRQSLFSSETEFDSRTGWPSFWKPLDNAPSNENPS